MTRRAFLRTVKGFAVVVVLMFFLCAPASAINDTNGEEQKKIRLFLNVTEQEDEILEVTVNIESDRGVCALLSSLEYNPDSLIYMSGGAGEDKINFKVIDICGEVRFLLDSTENSAPNGVLARFYFKKTGSGKTGLSLECINEALYIDDNGEISASEVKVIGLKGGEDNDEREEEVVPQLIELKNSGGILSFSVKASDHQFAAGVRLFFVDVSGEGEHFEAQVTGVVGEDKVFSGEYDLGEKKSYAVVVTPQGFERQAVDNGEKNFAFLH